MKKSIKKSLILCAVSAILISAASSALAAPTVRPMPGSSQTSTVTSSGTNASDEAGVSNDSADEDTEDADNKDTSANSEGETGVTRTAPTAIPTSGDGHVNILTDTEQQSTKKGVSIGAMILWLLISVIINAGVSFWIGNRFYRMSKKDTHITSEMRALRRDVEEKFLKSVGGFVEQETDIANSNEDYSMREEGITLPRRQRSEEMSAEEEDELLRKWESRQSNPRQARTAGKSGTRRKYQPTREGFEPDADEEENTSKSVIKNKAKGILSDMFPFKED